MLSGSTWNLTVDKISIALIDVVPDSRARRVGFSERLSGGRKSQDHDRLRAAPDMVRTSRK
jgi:hypothetical protein